MPYLKLLVIFLCGYVLGSVNLSILVARFVGKIDIHTVGSGNAGGTNLARAMGAKWGVGVIVAEILKALLLGLFAKYLFPGDALALGAVGSAISGATAMLGCLVGNMFPCFHGFQGGKGVTTCGAALLVLDYRVFLAILALFLVILLAFRMVSLCSLCAAVVMPFAVYLAYRGQPYGWIPAVIIACMGLCVILRHHANIRRILSGTENRVFSKKNKS